MKGLIQTKSVKVYTASDGKVFDDKIGAEKHQAALNLRGWFLATVDEATSALVAQTILDDLDGFREVMRPLVRKPRGATETEPSEATDAPAAATRRRRAA